MIVEYIQNVQAWTNFTGTIDFNFDAGTRGRFIVDADREKSCLLVNHEGNIVKDDAAIELLNSINSSMALAIPAMLIHEARKKTCARMTTY